MTLQPRYILICLVAFVVSLALTLLALTVMIDDPSIGFDTQLPRSAVLAPMIAVVSFWGICRMMRVPLDPVRTFLFGALAVYGLLYFFGRIVAFTQINSTLALIVVGIGAFVGCYCAIALAQQNAADQL